MNAPLLPQILNRRLDDAQADLPLDTEGVGRYVWEGRYGAMLIEVREGRVYVNGSWVEPAAGPAPGAAGAGSAPPGPTLPQPPGGGPADADRRRGGA
ncbi:hypothetical protein [Piscinibacter sakaiensis]|uniref:Uncharacterized protein n=1 Tax=Piscinibacter sakaiensis TaxID=1547922 RepID=A0A0K8P2X6_PISS1|nr:hypothetical protein [Piscinibacter sakaiensis]GAP36525.1 hypothetical protein ISF6_2365 [Piscinibacter sakaiensis]